MGPAIKSRDDREGIQDDREGSGIAGGDPGWQEGILDGRRGSGVAGGDPG